MPKKNSSAIEMDLALSKRKSVPRINTVVDFNGHSDESGDEDDKSEISQPLPIPQDRYDVSATGRSASAKGKSNQIAIELNVSTSPGGMDGVTAVNPRSYDSNFLTGPATLLTKSDIMYMIQEGVRMAVSQKANNNRVRQIKQNHPTRGSLISMSANMSVASSNGALPSGRKMKYILHQYKPKNFQLIRRMNGISSEEFISSICDSELLGGYTESSGKSGSLFWSSSDQKYIMKSISQEEARLMNSICTSYLHYMGSHPHSLLCKFLGMYKIVTTVARPSYIHGDKRASRVRAQVVHTTRFVIMNNVFAGSCGNLEKFDLKGTTEDRYVRPVSGKEVLKDINFSSRWISLPESLAECLNRVITEDCEFLFKHGLMDYSLIVGIARPVVEDPFPRSSGSNEHPNALSSVGPAREDIWDELTSTSWEDQLARSFQKRSRQTLGDKFNQQLLAAKSAAVKAAHSVHRLLTPAAKDVIVESTQQPSRLSSVEEHEGPIPNEHSPANKKKSKNGIESRSSSAEDIQRCNKSVFTSFKGGVAGIDETRSQPVIYYFGIIDMLQQYTIKKKMAHFVKKFTIGCCHEIDTVAPNYYHRRFEKYASSKIQALEVEEVEKIKSERFKATETFFSEGE